MRRRLWLRSSSPASTGRPAAALAGFRGVGEEVELHGSAGGVTVYDDYAHHPAGSRDAVRGERAASDARLLALFQPHLYSRTRDLAGELARALSAADAVCVTEIYPAREQPVEGVTGSSSSARSRSGVTVCGSAGRLMSATQAGWCRVSPGREM